MEVFIGSIVAFGFNFPPQGWASCNGQTVSIAEYNALFALLGTAYGGDGIQTFGLPNLQGRTPISQGRNYLGTYNMGESGGNNSITLTTQNMPMHNHVGANPVSVPVNNAAGDLSNPTGASLAVATGVSMYTSEGADGSMKSFSNSVVTVGITGGSQPFPVTDPYQAINYSISLYGIFPSRN